MQWNAIKLRKLAAYPLLEYSKSLPVLEKMITATSASQRTASSFDFLSKPARLFENVTCLLLAFSILLISILPLPIWMKMQKNKNNKKEGVLKNERRRRRRRRRVLKKRKKKKKKRHLAKNRGLWLFDKKNVLYLGIYSWKRGRWGWLNKED